MTRYLEAEPLRFPTSSSIRANTAFFSSPSAPTNSFTKISKFSTIPAYKHNIKCNNLNFLSQQTNKPPGPQPQLQKKLKRGIFFIYDVNSQTCEVSCPFPSRLVPDFSLIKATKSSKSLPPPYSSPALLPFGKNFKVGNPLTSYLHKHYSS